MMNTCATKHVFMPKIINFYKAYNFLLKYIEHFCPFKNMNSKVQNLRTANNNIIVFCTASASSTTKISGPWEKKKQTKFQTTNFS